jgi:hypothetical protein
LLHIKGRINIMKGPKILGVASRSVNGTCTEWVDKTSKR